MGPRDDVCLTLGVLTPDLGATFRCRAELQVMVCMSRGYKVPVQTASCGQMHSVDPGRGAGAQQAVVAFCGQTGGLAWKQRPRQDGRG